MVRGCITGLFYPNARLDGSVLTCRFTVVPGKYKVEALVSITSRLASRLHLSMIRDPQNNFHSALFLG